jgi:hypothetical protein
MKNAKRLQGRRPMPRIRSKVRPVAPGAQLTLGDLVSAAYDTLHDSGLVLRVLRSKLFAARIGRTLVFVK